MADPNTRFALAFDDPTLTWSPTWTPLDSVSGLVASYTIDRGRMYELDRTDTGRAQVEITDRQGILDPSNPTGPYYGKLEPLLQAIIRRKNPVSGLWQTRYRGFVEEYDYRLDPSQQYNKLTLSLVDIYEVLAAVNLTPAMGDSTGKPANAQGQVWYKPENMDVRIKHILADALIPASFYVVFSGNVECQATVYSPGESAMSAIQEAADAEFPGVSNVYTDRLGRLCVHGRLAKFDPATISTGAGAAAWDFHTWKVGDGQAVNASPADTAQIRRFAFNRGISKVINIASATPFGIADADVAGQEVRDTASISARGYRSWTAQNLITKTGLLDGSTALVETKRFAEYYVKNYKTPRNRVTEISFRSIRLNANGGAHTWSLLSLIDIADLVQVTVHSPGGGGFTATEFFVEGIHETCRPLNPLMDDVTLELDLSPRAYFQDFNPFPVPD